MEKRMNLARKLTLGAAVLGGISLFGASARADGSAEATYKAKCVTCHGADGKGETAAGKNMKAGSFSDPATAKMTDDELATLIAKGKNKMPAYKKSLKPDQVKDLVAYIRSLAKKS